MAETTKGDSLKGKLLIAMPAMTDPRFHKSVILMLEHSPEGAMGIIVNQPLEAVQFSDLLDQLKIPVTRSDPNIQVVHFGGPVELGRGFVVHSTDLMLAHSATLGEVAVTTSLEMLERLAKGSGPAQSFFCLGYAGWSAGQLDQELKDNVWLHAPVQNDLLFKTPWESRWDAALTSLGIDPDFISADAGHA